MTITSDLLTLATDTPILVLKRILLGVRVEEDLGVLVTEGEDVVIIDICQATIETYEQCREEQNTYRGSGEGARFQQEFLGTRGS